MRAAFPLLFCLLAWPAWAGGSSAPTSLPSSMTDVGTCTSQPFFELAMGQSNEQGEDPNGPKTVQPGILIVNDNLAGTAIVPAAYGQAPLGVNGGPDTVGDPSLAATNPAVSFANDLRLYWAGTCNANRPIVIIPSWLGGKSLINWVGQGTASPYWLDLLQQIAVVNAAYPGFQIDHMDFSQGDADGDPNGLTATPQTNYGSKAAYQAAFSTLLAQLRALPQWRSTGAQTTISIQELYPWADNEVGQARNDVLRSYRNGAVDSWITTTSSAGLTESSTVPPHATGWSVDEQGRRRFTAWLQGRIGGGYHNGQGLNPRTGGASVVAEVLGAAAGATLDVALDNMRSGGVQVNATGPGTTVNIPNFSEAQTALGQARIDLNVSGGGITLATRTPTGISAGGILADGASGTSVTLSSGQYRCSLGSSAWVCEQFGPRVGGSLMLSSVQRGAGNNYVAGQQQAYDSIVLLGGNNQFGLPTSSNGMRLALWNNGTAASTVCVMGTTAGTPCSAPVAGQAIIRPGSGATATSLILQPNEFVLLEVQGNAWILAEDSATASRATQVSAATSGTVTAASGVGSLSLLLSSASPVPSLTLALPSNPVDGSTLCLVSRSAVGSLAYANGSVDSTAPASLAAGGHVVLTYSAADGGKWF